MDPVIDAALRTALSLLFVAAAAHKLRDLGQFRATLAEYTSPPRLVPFGAGRRVGWRWSSPRGHAARAAASQVEPRRRGRGPLHHGGDGGESRRAAGAHRLWVRRAGRSPAVSGWLVARNATVAAAALTGLIPVGPRPFSWVDGITVAGATATLAALYASLRSHARARSARARLRGGA